MADPDDIRKSAVDFAQMYVGYDADPADPQGRMNYLDVIAPGEDDKKQGAMADESGCGLVVAGIWRALGVQSALLDAPYRTGSGLSRLLQIARGAGAWIPYAAGKYPKAGDAVIVGDNGSGGVQHV